MLKLHDRIVFGGPHKSEYQKNTWNDIKKVASKDGKTFIEFYQKNLHRYIPRAGEWSLPWPHEIPEECKMPKYDPTFKKSYNDVCNNRAGEIAKLIRDNDYKFAVMWSGGIDSTVILAALIKNLSKNQLKNIIVCANASSLIENPTFFKKFICNNFEILDSSIYKYDQLIQKNYYIITGELGDQLGGLNQPYIDTQQNYYYYIKNLSSTSKRYLISIKDKMYDYHYQLYKDLIIERFGEEYYFRVEKNIKTANVPIISFYDYMWWFHFNLKYTTSMFRAPGQYNDQIHCKKILDRLIFWYNSTDYQKWSMVNRRDQQPSAKKYIHELDKNDWYFYFKTKMDSGGHLKRYYDYSHLAPEQHPNAMFGMDQNYNRLYIHSPDVQEYIRHYVSTYKCDR